MWKTWCCGTILLAIAAACQPASPPETEENPLLRPPIDSARVSSVDEVAGWGYRRELMADLDGSGQQERVVLAAEVETMPDGTPLWEDGHRWALYVESASGDRTLLYGAFVPNGSVEAAVLVADDTQRRNVLIQERTPQRIRALEVEYHGPGRAQSSSAAYYEIDRWLPGAASMPMLNNDED